MKLTQKEIAKECLERIEELQEFQRSVDAAASLLRHRKSYRENIDYGNLRDFLFQDELDEWRNLFMWALTLEDAERDRIKLAAHERFLAKNMDVSKWFNGGVEAGSYMSATAEEFRKMAKEAFAPKVT